MAVPTYGTSFVETAALLTCLGAVMLLARRQAGAAPHDPEREIRRLTRKVRDPWPARAAWWADAG